MRVNRVDERGQVLPLMVLALALVAGGLVLVVELGRIADDRAQARTAADAAALAGAVEGRAAALALATGNGATVISYEELGEEVEVVVRVGRASARARARREVRGCNLVAGDCDGVMVDRPG